jgi:hypothetical protein
MKLFKLYKDELRQNLKVGLFVDWVISSLQSTNRAAETDATLVALGRRCTPCISRLGRRKLATRWSTWFVVVAEDTWNAAVRVLDRSVMQWLQLNYRSAHSWRQEQPFAVALDRRRGPCMTDAGRRSVRCALFNADTTDPPASRRWAPGSDGPIWDLRRPGEKQDPQVPPTARAQRKRLAHGRRRG